jgi:cytochrome c
MFRFINRYFGFSTLVIIFGFIGMGELIRATRYMSVAPDYVFSDTVIEQGEAAIEVYGCGSCHTIPGISSADARVGASLEDFGERTFVAGELANTPENLIAFLLDPQQINPGTDMPNLGLSPEEAANIAAYLYMLQD